MLKTVNSNHGLVLSNPYIGPLLGASSLGQSGPGSKGNEGVLRIPQGSSITGTSPLDCLVPYPGHSLRDSYPSAETQSVYSSASADSAPVHLLWQGFYLYEEKKSMCSTAPADLAKPHQRSSLLLSLRNLFFLDGEFIPFPLL